MTTNTACDLQFLIAMIASATNRRMQRKLDYTQEEVRVLKEVVRALSGTGRIPCRAKPGGPPTDAILESRDLSVDAILP